MNWGRRRYLTPELPAGLFLLILADGSVDARLRGADLVLADAETNTWVSYPEVGTPRWFRVVRQEGDRIWTADGDGIVHEVRAVPTRWPEPD